MSRRDDETQEVAGSGSDECKAMPLAFPFDPLPELDSAALREVRACALESNQRYLIGLVEENSFCPFSRGGRARQQTARHVYYASDADIGPVAQLLHSIADEPHIVVAQIIFPMAECSPQSWIEFCHEVTNLGHKKYGHGNDVFAVAPLHPALPYKEMNPFALIPLLRRAPDPTIQWVRLDALEALYEGRSSETVVVLPADIMSFLQKKHAPPLFDRIAETNMRMAKRLGIANVEKSLASIAESARKRYANILLGDTSEMFSKVLSEVFSESHPDKPCACPGGGALPAPLIAQRKGEDWDLGAVRAFVMREPRHVIAGDVDLVVVRSADVTDVLYGRCPHRMALLSEAIVDGQSLVCRQHGWDFSLTSGKSEGVPGESIHHFAASVHDSHIWIQDAEIESWRLACPQAFELEDRD